MKTILYITTAFLLFNLYAFNAKAQMSNNAATFDTPWTAKELIEPAALNAMVSKPIIVNIGVVENVKGAKHIGAASNAENLLKLKQTLSATPKDKMIVFYCGCCPFTKCPNIRPAYRELKAAGYTNIKLLNLPTNLKTDWIAKGYAIEK